MSSSISQVQNRARNLIEVLNTIEPGKPVALSDLAQRVETDTSTLRRDLDILSHCDIDMFYIDIDIDNYSIQLDVSEETLNKRRAENKLKPEQELSGYLKRYAKMVGSADTGASFKY